MEIKILEIIYGSKEYLDTLALRNKVFREPWGLNIKDDNLEEDKNMKMYGLYLEDGSLIGTVFLSHKDVTTAQIKALALLEEFRGIGLGQYLMQFIENIARKRNYTQAFLMSRVSAQSFYKQLAYKAVSGSFNYKTVPHINMAKTL